MAVFSRFIETTMFPVMFLTPFPKIEVGKRFPLFKNLSPKELDGNSTTKAAAHEGSLKQEVDLLRRQ